MYMYTVLANPTHNRSPSASTSVIFVCWIPLNKYSLMRNANQDAIFHGKHLPRVLLSYLCNLSCQSVHRATYEFPSTCSVT